MKRFGCMLLLVLASGCASDPDRYDPGAKDALVDQARRDAYSQGYNDAQRRQAQQKRGLTPSEPPDIPEMPPMPAMPPLPGGGGGIFR